MKQDEKITKKDIDAFINNADKNFFNKMKIYDALLSKQEEKNLINSAQKGDKMALESVVYHNYRYVVKKALEHKKKLEILGVKLSNYCDIMDIINAGFLGLTQAVSKFDISKGTALLTYADSYIDNEIRKCTQNATSMINIPDNVRDNLVYINKKFKEENITKPSFDDFKKILREKDPEITENAIASAMMAYNSRMVASSDAKDKDDDSQALIDNFADEKESNFPKDIEKVMFLEQVKEIVSKLDPIDRKIFCDKSGFNEECIEHTFDEIGASLGISKQAANKRYQKVMDILKEKINIDEKNSKK